MTEFMKQTLEQFARSLADRTPTPGGGTASAYVSLLGSSLGWMALRFSDEQQTRDAMARLEKLNAELAPLLDEDSRSYDKFQTAMKLSKTTAEEKARRTQAMQEALAGAAAVPLKTMQLCHRGLEIFRSAAGFCNKNLVSDMESGAVFLMAGLRGAAANVRINAQLIKNEDRKTRLMSDMETLIREAEALQAEVLTALSCG